MDRQLVIDCREPSRLVAFWAEALRYRPEPPRRSAEHDAVQLADPEDNEFCVV
ncbi:VOC family protein [Micromonospora avicenniae]|uniref:VOC family protein n=1 Tax=Micromonospora avicenniae TaxID=1198245 RepID=UPI00342E5B78